MTFLSVEIGIMANKKLIFTHVKMYNRLIAGISDPLATVSLDWQTVWPVKAVSGRTLFYLGVDQSAPKTEELVP